MNLIRWKQSTALSQLQHDLDRTFEAAILPSPRRMIMRMAVFALVSSLMVACGDSPDARKAREEAKKSAEAAGRAVDAAGDAATHAGAKGLEKTKEAAGRAADAADRAVTAVKAGAEKTKEVYNEDAAADAKARAAEEAQADADRTKVEQAK